MITRLMSFMVFSALVSCASLSQATDMDNNGLDDQVEFQLAEKYKPAFMLHRDRIVEPEPVEIMSANGSALTSSDLWISFFSLTSQTWLTVEDSDPISLLSQPYNYVWDAPGDPVEGRLDGLQFVAAPSIQDVNHCSFLGCQTYFHLQFGEWGEEIASTWAADYANGGPANLPGSHFNPRVYPHLFMEGNRCVIQYWMFYPYNDNINNHEGDWEHINVVLSSADPATSAIEAVDFYFHQRYMIVAGDNLGYLHMIDDTHPLIYVGGYGSLEAGGIHGSGASSGGSYPGFGSWDQVGAWIPILGIPTYRPHTEEVESGGRFLNYREVDLVIYPRVDSHERSDDNDGCGESYFEAHPSEAWMRANIHWGQYITAEPWVGAPGISMGTDIGNRAPRTPAYQSSWEDRHPDGFDEYHRYEFFTDNAPLLVTSIVAGGEEVRDVTILAGEFFETGTPSSWSTPSPAAVYLSSVAGVEGNSVQVYVPAVFVRSGITYEFDSWIDDGPMTESESRNRLRVGHLTSLTNEWIASYLPRAPLFVDVTAAPVQGVNRVTNSVEWADVDSDGDEDLYFGYGKDHEPNTYDSTNKMVRNDRLGALVDITPSTGGTGIDWAGSTVSAAFGDADNDGDQDLYLVNSDPNGTADANKLLISSLNNGTPTYTVSQLGAPLASLEDLHGGGRAEWVDIDCDGDLDLYVGRANELPALVFENFPTDGQCWLQQRAVSGLEVAGDAGQFSWGDFDNDGLVDVYVFRTNGLNVLLKNTGNWAFVDVSDQLGSPMSAPLPGVAAAWGDYDNDGDADLFVCAAHAGVGANRLYRNDAIEVPPYREFHEVAADVGLPESEMPSSSAGWTDIDRDGDLDLVIAGQSCAVFQNMYPLARFDCYEMAALDAPSEPLTMSFADFDLDGDEDIYVGVQHRNADWSGFSRLYRNDMNSGNGWIRVTLQGQTTNRDGVGARIRVTSAGGATQSRQITGALGGSSHAPRAQTIGLGHEFVAQSVRVDWPWGRVTEIPMLAAGSSIVITDQVSAPTAGAIYLTTSSTGERTLPSGSWNLGDYVDFYLAADFAGASIADASMGGFEVRVTPSGVFSGLTIEPLFSGVDADLDTWEFSVRFDANKPLGAGPIPLLRFRGQITREGGDGTVALEVARPCSFVDPIDPIAACWWGGESNVLYRFDGDLSSGGIEFPVIDLKAPLVTWCSLYPEYLPSDRSWVAVAFDEPLAESCFDSAFLLDLSHFRIYNPTNPLITKSILFAVGIGNNGYLLKLSSPIQAGKLFDLEVSGVSDRHGNVRAVSTVNVSLEEDPNIDLNEIFFAMAKSVSNSAAVEWVELKNSENAPICISGWTVANGAGGVMRVPDAPLCVLPPGGHAVLVAAGADTTGFNEDIVLVCANTQLALVDGTLVLLSPFGAQADVFDSGTNKDLGKHASSSYQRFAVSESKSAVWELDGPEYAPGLHGTPGLANCRLDGSGSESDLPVIEQSGLLRATPNPFNPAIIIELALKSPGRVRVRVYDVMGRVVRTLLDEHRSSAGLMSLVWDGRDSRGAGSASGVYFVKMDAPNVDTQSLKITLLR